MHERKLDDVLKHYGVKGMKWDEKLKSTVKKTKQSAMKIGSEAKESAMKIGSVVSKEGKSAYQKTAPKVKKASVKVGNEAKELGNAAKIKALRAYDKVKPEPKRDHFKELYRLQRTNPKEYERRQEAAKFRLRVDAIREQRENLERAEKEKAKRKPSKYRSVNDVKETIRDVKSESVKRATKNSIVRKGPVKKKPYTKIIKDGLKNVGEDLKYDVKKATGRANNNTVLTKPAPKKKTPKLPKKYSDPMKNKKKTFKEFKKSIPKSNSKSKSVTWFL